MKSLLLLCSLLLSPLLIVAQSTTVTTDQWLLSPGVIGTLILIGIVLIVGILIVFYRIDAFVHQLRKKNSQEKDTEFTQTLYSLKTQEIDEILEARKKALSYSLTGAELGSEVEVMDKKGLVGKVTDNPNNPLFDEKQQAKLRLDVSPELRKIVIWYLGAATFWLVFGTSIGQYLGMKFFWPDMESISWLGFGRLRPVHTNTVFWGWSSMAMIGLGYFVIARTSNTRIFSYKMAWYGWVLINLTVVLGNIALMSGVNNGGGEYREYIWPIMILFMIALILTFINFYKTVARRTIKDIYISNWFILAALGWTIILSVIGYLPFFQNGLGETVIQGYYMHMGVGMWFMTFTLGLVYYYLPASLNKPIYSYSLGVLAFWTQMLFYTMIGTHHFVFSPLPWWLQTIAIVFSMGMFIPVIAGTTNFLMTMRGSWSHISKSYVLPFFLVGAIFYFVGSGQGSFQAFRFTNFLWHFTDFNVAHSHMTMYGIVAFFLWASFYAIMPKLTGKEPPQILVGAHFWMAFVGLFSYMISLMVGGTEKGLSWIDNRPFIESVTLMAPYWVWRAVGGSMMLISHIIFAINFIIIVRARPSNTPIAPTETSDNSNTKLYGHV
ncbi:cytochrome oxidase subunit I [Cryomorpha ignava]|uniref:Cytochrome oxidase subunit I n=1 Tax=Cryomorpha ignava TaxID=101383 RepID=A0A7K3WQ64_9FLAO|nr:cbb3-type cytochrome c oxidase subunit I [Cryomorpha ignava]NEN23809.1 cytochrome oxidase subunit I [Cryomorpha ignava]